METKEEKKQRIKEERSKRMKEYTNSITPEQRKEMVEKAKITRSENGVIKEAISNVFKKQYLVHDVATGKCVRVSGAEVGVYRLMKDLMCNDTSNKDVIETMKFLADYSGNKPSEKKETTNLNVSYESSLEDFKKYYTEVEVIENNEQ